MALQDQRIDAQQRALNAAIDNSMLTNYSFGTLAISGLGTSTAQSGWTTTAYGSIVFPSDLWSVSPKPPTSLDWLRQRVKEVCWNPKAEV